MSGGSLDAIILAGRRPGIDPFAASHGAPLKALIPVGGEPMLSRVAGTLTGHPDIGPVHILAQDVKSLQNALGKVDLEQTSFVESDATIASSLQNVLDKETASYPLLVTTADNVLLDEKMIDHFRAAAHDCDIAVAVVEKQTLLTSYPASRRTWLKFSGGQFSGANLFYLGSSKARTILRYWAEAEQDRKKGWKMLGIFGPWLPFLALTRLISIHEFADRVGRKLGLKVTIVEMPQAEACIDVDRQSDLELVEQILEKRGN